MIFLMQKGLTEQNLCTVDWQMRMRKQNKINYLSYIWNIT